MSDPSTCNSFLDSEPGDSSGVYDSIDGDFDVAGTLFASLFTDVSNQESTNTLSDDIMSSTETDCDEISSYLSSSRKDVQIEPQEIIQRKMTRSASRTLHNDKNAPNTTKQSVYSRPPLMCSSKVNTKSVNIELNTSDKQETKQLTKVSSDKYDKCMNKSAIIARENREKKKKYVQQLETNYEDMKYQNFDLQSKLEKKSKLCDSLQKEIQYLRNVLANQSSISALLKNIHSTPGLSFSSSIELSDDGKSSNTKKRQLDENYNYDNKSKGVYVRATGSHKKVKQDTEQPAADDYSPPLTPVSSHEDASGGVCLHVNNNKVSLELCSKCAENASIAWNKAGDHTYFKN